MDIIRAQPLAVMLCLTVGTEKRLPTEAGLMRFVRSSRLASKAPVAIGVESQKPSLTPIAYCPGVFAIELARFRIDVGAPPT
jgi:hypothetical protein